MLDKQHAVADIDIPLGRRSVNELHQEIASMWKLVRASQETIDETRQLLVRIDRLLTPLIE